MTLQHDRIGDYIRRHSRLGCHAAASHSGAWQYSALPELIPADQLADEFLQDAEFGALKLGTWLGTTDGQLIAEAVSQVISPAYEPAFSLTVDALQIAASRQTKFGRQMAGSVALAVLATAALIAASVSDS